jgi:tetratricopeptide (TPR) repeat protein
MLALNDFEWGRCREARDRLAQMTQLVASNLPVDADLLAEMRLNYAEVLAELGEAETAEAQLVAVRDHLGAQRGADAGETAEALAALGFARALAGKLDAAESDERAALQLLQEAKLTDSALALSRLSQVLLARGDVPAAVENGRAARDNALAIAGAYSHPAALAHYRYGAALAAAHDSAAEGELRNALDVYARLLPDGAPHPRLADVKFTLGQLLAEHADRSGEARQLLDDALSMRRRYFDESDVKVREVGTVLQRLSTAVPIPGR